MSLLTLYNISEASGNPTSMTGLLPGGAGVQVAGTISNPFLAAPRLEQQVREVLDATSVNGVPSPAPTGSLLIWNPLLSGNTGAALWTVPNQPNAVALESQYGIILKPGSPFLIDSLPLGSGDGAEVVFNGPCNALCVAPTAGGPITPGAYLVSDGSGNLQPIQPPSAAPTPTVTPVGTTGSTAYSYALVSASVNGTYSAIGTAGTTATGNATLTTANYNQITWTPVVDSAGYLIVRTASAGTPATTGTIGFVPAGTSIFNDTGLSIQPNTTATQPFATLAAGGTPTVAQVAGATAGSATWSYKIAAIAPNGVWGAAGTAGSVTTGNATLSAVNGNKITWTATTGATQYAIQRSASGGTPSTTGFIGYASPAQATSGFVDYGQAATTYTQNTTPLPNPISGIVLARAIGSLATTTTPTLTAVFVAQD